MIRASIDIGSNSVLLLAAEINLDSKKIVRKVVGHYIHEPELHKYIKEITGK
jgi:hypothetical protein